MPRHQELRRLPYSAEAMFDLVADVARYPEFLPWISAVRVKSNSDTAMVADLLIGFKALRERFTSRVVKERPIRLHVDYLDGPLKYLRNEWKFTPTPEGCEVDFTVDFQFRNRVFEAIAGQVFDQALRRMINAFETRANALYAAPRGISSSSATSVA